MKLFSVKPGRKSFSASSVLSTSSVTMTSPPNALLELISHDSFALSPHVPRSKATSVILLCNTKLLELAVSKAIPGSTLFIAFSDDLEMDTSEDLPLVHAHARNDDVQKEASCNVSSSSTSSDEDELSDNAVDPELIVRKQLSNIYNQLWDFCLTAQKLGLDCRVLLRENLGFKSKGQIMREQRITTVFNSGISIDTSATTFCLKNSKIGFEVVDLSASLSEELALLEQDFMLFNSPGQSFNDYDDSEHGELNSATPKSPKNGKQNVRMRPRRFDEVVLGGTFDHFHNGHKALLTTALIYAQKRVVVGVTGDELLKTKKNRNEIENISTRMDHVKQFVMSIQDRVELDLCEINDMYGPSTEIASLSAIVVSSETIKGARMVNERRIEKGLKPLFIIVVMRSNIHTLSSTFVRKQFQAQNPEKDMLPPKKLKSFKLKGLAFNNLRIKRNKKLDL